MKILSCLPAVLLLAVPLKASDKVTLREELRPDETYVVSLELKANGDLLLPQSDQKNKAQSILVNGRFSYEEKILPPAPQPDGTEAVGEAITPRSLRYYTASSLESTVNEKRVARELREPVRLMVAEWRAGHPFLFSPSGPLTVEEYEMVEADASLDSLTLGGLLPLEPVAAGDMWKPSDAAVAAILNVYFVEKNELQVTLSHVDESQATMTVTGHVEGIAGGAYTRRNLSGQVVFDRVRSKIIEVEIHQREDRKAGPLGSALDVRAQYTLRRNLAPVTQLNSEVIQKIPLQSNPATELLVYVQPDGRYRCYFQRGWFVTMSHPHAAVLRLLEDGVLLSECHILAAPTVAAGTHLKPDEFRAQVEQALGKHFKEIIQEGEVPAPKGHWIYRIAVAGESGGQPVIWIYHVAAGPQGHQLVFIFRVPAAQFDRFGAKDLALVGAIEFEPAKTANSSK